MATKFRLRRSATADKRPIESDLLLGELALNTYDGRLYTKRDTNNVGIADTAALLTPWTENFGGGSIYYSNGVGVGQTNPNKAKLHVVADTGSTEKIVAKFRNPQGVADNKAKIGLVCGYSDTANDTEGQAYIGAQREGSGNTSALFFETYDGTLTERLRITAAGKVGMGMDPTSQYFNNLVIGNNVSGDKGITIRTNSDSSGVLAFSDTDAGDANRYDGYIRYSHIDQHMGFYTAGANERLRINSSGYVGINTTVMSNSERVAVRLNDDDLFELRSHAQELFQVWKEGSTEECRLNLKHNGSTKIHLRGNGLSYLDGGHVIIGGTSWGAAGSMSIASYGGFRSVLASGQAQDTMLGAISGVSNGFQINTDASNNQTYTFHNGSTVSLRIKSDGKVLVGSGCTDASAFNVKGSAGFADDGTNAGLIISTDDANGAALSCLTTGGFVNGSYGNMRFNALSHKFTYGNTQRLLIDSTGLATFGGEIATAQDYPNYRPTIDFNFVAVKKLDPRITYFRTGPASYVDEYGKVVLVGENTPRFDHDPMTGESKGLLIEESRTNNNKVATNEWNATGWTSEKTTLEHYSSETAPDGSTNVTLVYPTTANDSHYHYISHAGNSYSGSRTCSAWFKKLSTTTYFPQLRIFGAGSGKAHAVFTLTGDGSVTSGGNAKTNATITRYPNDWYRCTLSWTYASGHWGGGIVIGNDSSTEIPTFTGDADKTKGFLVWGFQDEVGLFPTSLIPTNGVAATRGADTAFIDGQDFTDAYNVSEGTFVLKQSVDDTATGNQWGWGVEKSTNRSGFFNGLGFRVGGGGAGYVGAWFMNNGSQQAFFNMNAGALVNIPFVSTLAYKVNDMAATTNGMTVATDTSASIVAAGEFDRFTLGTYHYDTISTGHIQRVMYYKQRLPNSQLVTLTS